MSSRNDDKYAEQFHDDGPGEDRSLSPDRHAEDNINGSGPDRIPVRPKDDPQPNNSISSGSGTLPALNLNDTDYGSLFTNGLKASDSQGKSNASRSNAPGTSGANPNPLETAHEHRDSEDLTDDGITNATGTKTAGSGTKTDASNSSNSNHLKNTWSENDDRRSSSRISSGFGNFNIPDEHSDSSEGDGFGRFNIPNELSDRSDASFGFGAPHNFSPPQSEGAPFDNAMDSEMDDIWNQEMHEDDDDVLGRLLADREGDEERLMNIHNNSFFDLDAEHDRLLDDLLPLPAPSVKGDPEEPRFLNEDELRRHLPDHQEIYRMATYFDEAVNIALPFDEEFDCQCTDHGLPPVSGTSRKRAANEPLDLPSKKPCPRVPSLDWLTQSAPPPRKCYIELPRLQISDDGSFRRTDTSVSTITTAQSIESTVNLNSSGSVSADESADLNTLSTQRSYSTTNTARSLSTTSIDDLETARALSPVPAPLPMLLPNAAPFAVVQLPPLQPQNILQNDIEDSVEAIKSSLKLIGSNEFRRNTQTLDFVTQLQRIRTTLRRLLKELNAGIKSIPSIEKSFDKVDRKLIVLISEINRQAKTKMGH